MNMSRYCGNTNRFSLLIASIILLSTLPTLSVSINASADADNVIGIGGGAVIAPVGFAFFSFMEVTEGDFLYWSWDTTSTTDVSRFVIILPDLSHNTSCWNNEGMVATMTGSYAFGLFNDDLFSTVKLTFTGLLIKNQIEVISPHTSSLLNTKSTNVEIECDGADGVFLGTSLTYMKSVSQPSQGNWKYYGLPLKEGVNTIFVRGYFELSNGAYNYTVTTSIVVEVDTSCPTINISSPIEGTEIRGSQVAIAWSCDDPGGIAIREIRIDDGGWEEIPASTYVTNLSTGAHAISIRAIDNADNQAIKTINISVDADVFSLGGPYYGLPSIIIVLLIISVLILSILNLMTRNKIRAIKSKDSASPIKVESFDGVSKQMESGRSATSDDKIQLPPPPSDG